ncbi:Malonyl CoA-acyl carrier protein transacylase [Wickerhamomyces ciferrii]|uniref:[acyl-carrier-protein] S-malonyltransferase n=1 Tax=Wickerhamomyces ciferrii (strain ATCC 14091 / BCRC 22168 / CBS 111 / JCM 3599 / NBRC 0793 / NRRL Y-1031 F-60-10) TaxID=1206466 RepID=K0KSD9_WICCF|nr:Malonyl CoA-acyl carrier protein transacylase [Wickerhamomyces ciferrii]CCH44244.1 Malonyl CoA-acyl carrier protein transacylase [Wickerhamomyces ciferrii]
MMFKRLFSTSTVVRGKKLLTFPGQGQPVEKTFVQELSQKYDLESYFKSLKKQISSSFVQNVQSPSDDFYLSTSNTQPSIVSLSLLTLEILKKHHGIDLIKDSDYTMGHSLGEYTSLCINNVFQHNQDQILWLVRQRGVLMEEALAHSKNQYGMTALVFPAMNYEDVEVLLTHALKETSSVAVANINSTQQIVISGIKSELEQVVNFVKERSNIKRRLRVFPLSVTTPFHNPLLQSSKDKFRGIINEKFNIDRESRLQLPIISNFDGQVSYTHGEALDKFIDDFINPVQFKDSIENAIKDLGVNTVWNIGPNGHVNQGNIGKTDIEKKLETNQSISNIEDFETFVENYNK